MMEEGTQGSVETVEVQPVAQQPLAAHRGTLILILGILSLVCCFICGIVAWVMGNGDLKEMAAGRMDPAGEGMTKAGKICGIIGIALQIVILLLQLLGVGLLSFLSVRHVPR